MIFGQSFKNHCLGKRGVAIDKVNIKCCLDTINRYHTSCIWNWCHFKHVVGRSFCCSFSSLRLTWYITLCQVNEIWHLVFERVDGCSMLHKSALPRSVSKPPSVLQWQLNTLIFSLGSFSWMAATTCVALHSSSQRTQVADLCHSHVWPQKWTQKIHAAAAQHSQPKVWISFKKPQRWPQFSLIIHQVQLRKWVTRE